MSLHALSSEHFNACKDMSHVELWPTLMSCSTSLSSNSVNTLRIPTWKFVGKAPFHPMTLEVQTYVRVAEVMQRWGEHLRVGKGASWQRGLCCWHEWVWLTGCPGQLFVDGTEWFKEHEEAPSFPLSSLTQLNSKTYCPWSLLLLEELLLLKVCPILSPGRPSVSVFRISIDGSYCLPFESQCPS